MSGDIWLVISVISFLCTCYLMYHIGYNKGRDDANYDAGIITGKDAKKFNEENGRKNINKRSN